MAYTRKPITVRFDKRGIHVFESRHAPGFAMRRQQWAYDKLCVIETGSGTLEYEQTACPITAHDVLYLPAHSTHRLIDDPDNPLSLMMACFHRDTWATSPPYRALLNRFGETFPTGEPFALSDQYRLTGVMNVYRLMILEQSRAQTGCDAMIWSQLFEVLVFLLRATQQRDVARESDPTRRCFQASLALIHNEFYRPIQIEELAQIANTSYRSYTERFKRETGKTVNQYLAELRVDYAKQRMQESGNILHAALQAGFGDLGHFYRVFKRVTGTTPKTYMKNL